MGFKKERLGPRLVGAARSGERNRDAHVFLGGTGAVGGTALLQLLSLYEEMFSIEPPSDEQVPVLVATGTTGDEITAFTRRLFRFLESRHGPHLLPRKVRNGYLTHSGVFIALERFQVTAVPELRRVAQTPPEGRREVVGHFLEAIGSSFEDPEESVLQAISKSVASARPFGEFLENLRRENLQKVGISRIRSVVLGIPIPSLVAYHQDELAIAAEHIGGLAASRIEELKDLFIEALRDDLVQVQANMADTLVMAHTTGVGGMYDEAPGEPLASIRLGFAHSALDERLAEKHRFAEKITRLYSEAGINVLVTAAAIGIDEVRVRERIPLHRQIRQKLFDAPGELFPGSKGSKSSGTKAGRDGGRPLPAGQFLRVFRPLTVPLHDPPPGPATFDRGEDIVPSYAIRSGENGFFSVANADALYRVMRVASASELGLMLATVGLLGDDRLDPWFRGNIAYYDETDNARQVLDFLTQPALLRSELSGLEPMALQDLGSAKHQGELHTLALLILLHRLRTFDIDAVDPYVDLERFDPESFFVEHSRALTFEDVAAWEFDALARDVQTLAGAEEPEDLLPLTPPREHGLFPKRKQALDAVLRSVLRAVWTVPSLGSPLIYEKDGVPYLRTGYYVAPLDLLVTEQDSVMRWMDEAVAGAEGQATDEELLGYHIAVGGFVDLRPHAIVCSAKSDREPLAGRVVTIRDAGELRRSLSELEPYRFFATAGLLAVWYRLRALYELLAEGMIELGTLQEFRWHMPRDQGGHILLVPGVVEAFRMAAEGLEKTTGTERLDGLWGYERRPVPDRRNSLLDG